MSSTPFFADYDKRGAAKCKKCKQKLEKGALRIAKVVANYFSEDAGEMKQWHHLECLFEVFKKARATTKKIDDPQDDIGGWDLLEIEDKKLIENKVKEFHEEISKKASTKKNNGNSKTPTKLDSAKQLPSSKTKIKIKMEDQEEIMTSHQRDKGVNTAIKISKDDLFKEFRRLCAAIAGVSSYLSKTKLISDYFHKGADGGSFKGDMRLWVHLLLPGVVKRVYNLQSKQLIKLFSQIFHANQDEMMEDLEKGDVAETIRIFFEASNILPPAKKSCLTLQEVDSLLNELEGQTTEENHMNILKKVAIRSTGNDLKMFIRLVKGDLRINAGAKHILEGVHPDAYEAFQTTRNLQSVLDQVLEQKDAPHKDGKNSTLKIEAKVMTPVLPMLAEACRSVNQALKKCPNGMYAEIKYDGERVQVHKKGTEFKYFSRSLKPVMSHKVSHFKDFIPSAFPVGQDLILDAEVLLIDTKTSLPLPFGTLGKHKKDAFQDANVCLFVFDCIHYNGQNLMDRPISERRKILEKSIKEIPNHVVLSEMKEAHKAEQLQSMIQSVLSQGLEGLVLKDLKSIYEPGKRHWLKVKKDYLNEGAMADSADLVVLGASYGTGKRGGMMSVFLMGCYDPFTKEWRTVTKVHTGHDDAALERLQTELKMDKISQNYDSLPSWLKCSRSLTPDFVAKNPKESPVWEITGAEFTQNKGHTADGISIRFPRVTKVRPDKGWMEATDLPRLRELFKISKEHSDIVGLQDHNEDRSFASGNTSSGKTCSELESSPETKHSRDKDSLKHKSISPLHTESPKKLKQTTLLKSLPETKQTKNKEPLKRKSLSPSKVVSPKKMKQSTLLEKSPVKTKNERVNNYCKKDMPVKSNEFIPPIEKPLPDIFAGIKLHIPENIENSTLLYRYFIAYGGETVEEFSEEETHSLSKVRKNNVSDAKFVTVDWLWDSVKLQNLQPTKLYSD